MSVAGASALAAGLGVLGAGGAGAAPSGRTCSPNAGGTGLSAAVVARSHEKIASRTINAAGCDIGIYVGKDIAHVTIDSVRVTGASFQGILAEKTSHLIVERSTITGTGFKTIDPSAPPLPGSGVHSLVSQSFAISLFGVSHSTVKGNRVFNNGRGGIGLMDNGPNDPGAITQDHAAPLVPSRDDVITGNTTFKNYGGCGIVLATQNLGGSISSAVVSGNVVRGTGMSKANGPDIGGIVVAADLPNSKVHNVRVSANTVTGSWEGGVIVNAEAFNSSTSGVSVTKNTVSRNNWGKQEAPSTAGIIVFANPKAQLPPHTTAPGNAGTVVAHNKLSGQFYGIWSMGSPAPKTRGNTIKVTKGGTPIFPVPKPRH